MQQQAPLYYSKHAQARASQRGVRKHVAEFIYENADRERPVGGDCCELSVSRKKLAELVRDDKSIALVADRARSVRLIVAGTVLVTIYHA